MKNKIARYDDIRISYFRISLETKPMQLLDIYALNNIYILEQLVQ